MEDIKYNEEALVESREARERYMEHAEILDKVKQLFLIPGMECLTTTQVAEFYEVGADLIRQVYRRNAEEFNEDGVSRKRISDFASIVTLCHDRADISVSTSSAGVHIKYGNTELSIPNVGTTVFPKRAVLRMGMLLRDSKVAKEVRTQLLNTFEKTTPTQRVSDIETERELLMGIAKAFNSGEMAQLIQASQALDVFRKRHIEALEQQKAVLEEEKTILAGQAYKWADRSCLAKIMRTFAGKLHTTYESAYTMLFNELLYKHGIGLKMRGKKPYSQWIKPDEYPKVYQSVAALCEACDINTADVFAAAKMTPAEAMGEAPAGSK